MTCDRRPSRRVVWRGPDCSRWFGSGSSSTGESEGDPSVWTPQGCTSGRPMPVGDDRIAPVPRRLERRGHISIAPSRRPSIPGTLAVGRLVLFTSPHPLLVTNRHGPQREVPRA
jgi:hypothetical protein